VAAGALDEIRKVLTRFGCSRFGTMTDNENGELHGAIHVPRARRDGEGQLPWLCGRLVEGTPVQRQSRMRVSKVQHEARGDGSGADQRVLSMLRDWIKGQVTAIEVGILTFEGAFLGQILLSNGKTVLDTITAGDKPLLRLEAP
jgi:hypothetical protein